MEGVLSLGNIVAAAGTDNRWWCHRSDIFPLPPMREGWAAHSPSLLSSNRLFLWVTCDNSRVLAATHIALWSPVHNKGRLSQKTCVKPTVPWTANHLLQLLLQLWFPLERKVIAEAEQCPIISGFGSAKQFAVVITFVPITALQRRFLFCWNLQGRLSPPPPLFSWHECHQAQEDSKQWLKILTTHRLSFCVLPPTYF